LCRSQVCLPLKSPCIGHFNFTCWYKQTYST
jgi:hypothetical protein